VGPEKNGDVGPRDPLDEVISLAEASRLSGLAPHTLTLQAEKGKLRARKLGHTWITTRHWLDVYLATHSRHRHRSRESCDATDGQRDQ
jgi:hypothetical protein